MEQGSAEPGPGPYTMDGLCNLYLPVILLMRSGDIETNPGPNTPESTVSEEEYLELSERIGASNYKRVGIRLGIPYTVLSGIQHQSDDYSDHFMKVFMKWRDKQPQGTNTRAVLAEELQTCHLDELSDLLLDGSLVQSRTTKPSAQPITSQPHQPLSPELVQRCSEDFKFKYRTTLCKIRADPLNPDSLMQFEDIYTNLVLEKEEKHGRTKRKLEYSGLWNLKDNGKFPRRLLVQGEAGAGKTTLCAKIAWDWISGKHLQDISWLIVVPLREAQKYTIGEIAKSYLTSNNPTTASQLTEYMHLNPDKVFILFDGLDEFSGDVVQDKEDGSQSRGQESHSHQSAKATGQASQAKNHSSHVEGQSPQVIEIREILRSQKLESCPVIVTTRPWKAREIRWNDGLRKQYTFLYVEGFSKQNVAEYIRKYFAGEEAKAETLIQFANDNDVISENMAPYPIYIAMLCLMWREFDEDKRETMKSLQTFSQIFKEMFVFLKEHYALKLTKESCSVDESLNDRLHEINLLLEPIASLAFDGLLNKTLVFKEGDFEKCPYSMKTACRVGVLSEENRIIPRKERHNASNLRKQSTVFFPHKLFQEYMAGIHLASLYETDKAEYSRLIEKVTGQRKEEFRYLLYFTASQNQTVGINVLTHIERSMQREDDSHFLVDVAFECHDTDTASLVKDKVSLPNSALNIDHRVTAHTVAGYAIIQPDMVRLTVSRPCGPTMSHNVAEMICSVPSLKEVSLQSKLHINFFMTLAAQGQISQVESLKISVDGNPVSYAVPVSDGDPLSYEFDYPLKGETGPFGPAEPRGPMGEIGPGGGPGIGGAPENSGFMGDMGEPGEQGSIGETGSRGANGEPGTPGQTGPNAKSPQITEHKLPVCAPALHDVAVALCSMRNLTELTVPSKILLDEFCSTLNVRASSMKVKSLKIIGPVVNSSASSLPDLAVALCSMPNLTELTLPGTVLHHEFCSTLKVRASSMKVKSFEISGDVVPVSAPTSHDLVVALWSMPNLTKLTMPGDILSHEFCSRLKARASSMKVKSLKISEAVAPVSAPALRGFRIWSCDRLRLFGHNICCTQSQTWQTVAPPIGKGALHDLVVALCSMPNLTELTVPCGILSDEFCSTLEERALSMKLKFLEIFGNVVPVSAPASHDLAVALCSVPNLTELRMTGEILSDEFCSTLKARALSMKSKSFQITGRNIPVSALASHDLAVALCSMPNLTELMIADISDEFCSTMKSRALSMKLKSFQITGHNVHVSALALHDLTGALCSMPDLTELMIADFSDEFCAALKAGASSMKVKSFKISWNVNVIRVTSPALHDLIVALCSMPDLTELSLPDMLLSNEFCSTLKSRALSMKLKSLEICGNEVPVSAPVSPDLAVALCSMPNLTELTMPSRILSDEFCSALKAKASSMKNCFPQIAKGNFTFNGTPQANLESFICMLPVPLSTSRPRRLDTSVSVMRESHSIPSFSPLDQSSMPYDQPSTSRDLGDVYQTYHEEHGSMSRHSGYSTSHPVSSFDSLSEQQQLEQLVQLSVPFDQPSTSRDFGGVYQKYHEEHGSMSRHLGYSIADPMSSFDSHSEPTSSQSHQISDRPMSIALQLPYNGRSWSGRSESVKRTAPCTQSRVPKDIPKKGPRVGTPEESPSVKLCDYSSSDESSSS